MLNNIKQYVNHLKTNIIDPMLKNHAKPCVFYRPFALIAGSATGGLFLSHLYYWSDKGTRLDGFIYKTYQQWWLETALSRREWENAREALEEIGLIQCRRFGTDPKLYYKINFEVLIQTLTNSIQKLQQYIVKDEDTSMIDELEAMKARVAETLEKFPLSDVTLGKSHSEPWAMEGMDIGQSNLSTLHNKEYNTENTYKEYFQSEGEEATHTKKNGEEKFCAGGFGHKQTEQVNLTVLDSGFGDQTQSETLPDSALATTSLTGNIAARPILKDKKTTVEWEDFDWLKDFYRDNRPSKWVIDKFPPTDKILGHLKRALEQVGGDMDNLKAVIYNAFQRVESQPQLWNFSFEWMSEPSRLQTLAWEYECGLYAPSNQLIQEYKRKEEQKIKFADLFAEYGC